MADLLQIRGLLKEYGSFRLGPMDLRVQQGEYYVLLGRSGAGKSQLLEVVAGLEKADGGSIYLKGRDITNAGIQNRSTGMVFQDFAIFPHMTVRQNLLFPLRSGKWNREARMQRAEKLAAQVNISHLMDRKTATLSGGEKQRVALARTLTLSPDILLLDEPLASVDASLRDDLRRLLRQINRQGQTVVHVTHDYKEALSLAHRIGIIHQGHLIQEGDPVEVFRYPVNRFVAQFAGIQNLFKVRFEGEEAITRKGTRLVLGHRESEEEGLVMLRPEDITLSREKLEASMRNALPCQVVEVNRREGGLEVRVQAGEDVFQVYITESAGADLSIAEGRSLWMHFKATALQVLPSTRS